RIIARARLAGSEAALPHDAQELCAALERKYCAALESQLGKCESIGAAEELDTSSGAARQSAVDPARAIQELATGGVPEGAGWSVHVDSDLAAQLESYRRLPIL